MTAQSAWSAVLSVLDDEKIYSLHEIQALLLEYGHKVNTQAIYRWIKRRRIPKHSMTIRPHSRQNLACWLGADLKNGFEPVSLD